MLVMKRLANRSECLAKEITFPVVGDAPNTRSHTHINFLKDKAFHEWDYADLPARNSRYFHHPSELQAKPTRLVVLPAVKAAQKNA